MSVARRCAGALMVIVVLGAPIAIIVVGPSEELVEASLQRKNEQVVKDYLFGSAVRAPGDKGPTLYTVEEVRPELEKLHSLAALVVGTVFMGPMLLGLRWLVGSQSIMRWQQTRRRQPIGAYVLFVFGGVHVALTLRKLLVDIPNGAATSTEAFVSRAMAAVLLPAAVFLYWGRSLTTDQRGRHQL